jgi:hypothetical protein
LEVNGATIFTETLSVKVNTLALFTDVEVNSRKISISVMVVAKTLFSHF